MDILFNTRNHWTIFQQNLLIDLMYQINSTDKSFRSYKLKTKDLTAQKRMSLSQIHIDTAILLNRTYEIDEGERLVQISILSSISFFKNEGIIEVTIAPFMKSYFLKLKEKYTLISIKSLLSLKSIYAKKLYKWLKNAKEKELVFEISRIKKELSIENKYQDYSTFKKRSKVS